MGAGISGPQIKTMILAAITAGYAMAALIGTLGVIVLAVAAKVECDNWRKDMQDESDIIAHEGDVPDIDTTEHPVPYVGASEDGPEIDDLDRLNIFLDTQEAEQDQ